MTQLRRDRQFLFTNTEVSHRGKTVIDIASSPDYRLFLETLEASDSKVAKVPNTMEGRPDLLAYAAYGTSDLWWLIVLANSVYDYEEDLKAGTLIKIPQI